MTRLTLHGTVHDLGITIELQFREGVWWVIDYTLSRPVEEWNMYIHNDVNRIIAEYFKDYPDEVKVAYSKLPYECERCMFNNRCGGDKFGPDIREVIPCYGVLTPEEISLNEQIPDEEKKKLLCLE
jgi:hypothetical protein